MRENNHTNFVLVHSQLKQLKATYTHTHTHTHTQKERERENEREKTREHGAHHRSHRDVILVLRELSFSFCSVSNNNQPNDFSFPRRKSPLE